MRWFRKLFPLGRNSHGTASGYYIFFEDGSREYK